MRRCVGVVGDGHDDRLLSAAADGLEVLPNAVGRDPTPLGRELAPPVWAGSPMLRSVRPSIASAPRSEM